MEDWTAVALANQLRRLSELSIGKSLCDLDIYDRSAECQLAVRAALSALFQK